MKALQGAWDVVALEVDGIKMAEGMGSGAQIILKGDTFTTISMGAAYVGTFAVDTKQTPHTIDITFTDGPHAGQQSLGIFKFDGITWILCLGLAGNLTRPRDFVTMPGSGHALETLTRSTSRPKAGKPRGRSARKTTAPNSETNPVPVSDAIGEHSGDWSMVLLDRSGGPAMDPAYLSFGRRIVRGNEMSVTMNGQVMLKVTFSVDNSTKPRSIDYIISTGPDAGKTQLGIFELTGDTAQYCMSAPGNNRPTEFVTNPGDARTLSVWKKLASNAVTKFEGR